MAVIKSSIPYAKALFDLAKEKNKLAEFKDDAHSLLNCVNQSDDLGDLISNPTIVQTSKIDILSKLFTNKLNPEVMGFLTLLVNKGRIAQLGSICEAFINMINKESNTVQVKITTATQISDDTQKQIAGNILGKSKYEIEHIIDPTILGGYVIEFENKMLDNSISNNIQTIKNNLNK